MNSTREIAANRHRSMQLSLALFSVIFVAVVTYGYYHLLLNFGWFLALIGGLMISAIAWLFAKVAGTSDGGRTTNWVLVAPLFLISAAGVYNTMMMYLEGGQIMIDATANAQQGFARMENVTNLQLEANGVTKRTNKVNSLRDALFSEIRNPLNCGQGPTARQLIGQIQGELPNFQPLSQKGNSCSDVDAVIDDYKARIDSLILRAPWNDAELSEILSKSSKARATLSALQVELARSFTPGNSRQIQGILEGVQTEYQDLLIRLGRKTNTSDLPPRLDIVGAQSLGNVSKLPALFFSRMGEVSTWVYLIFAFGFDLLLVYLFKLVSRNRVKSPAIAGAISGAW